MLTEEKLLTLIKFHWNAGLLRQQGSAAEQALLADVEVEAAAELLQDLQRYHRGLVSRQYARQIHQTLLAACADEATAQLFIGYASTL